MKKGSIMMVAKKRRKAAIASGFTLLILMRIEAVETANMLISKAKFGGNFGFSITTNQR